MRGITALMIGALLIGVLLAGCSVQWAVPGPARQPPTTEADAFTMPDGFRLPFRAWLPDGTAAALHPLALDPLALHPLAVDPWAVVLALHGMNDSRNAWDYMAPELAGRGIAVFGIDQRGFGDTATRALWPGTEGLAGDARAVARLLRARYPAARLILLGESMGAAVLMILATGPEPPAVDGYVLIAPAVWGRARMNPFLRFTLWAMSNIVPGMRLTGGGVVKVTASNNKEALRRLSTDPLTIHGTRVDAMRGLVDLMDGALAASPRFNAPSLFVYGGKDELIPKQAMAATWRALPNGPMRAYYEDGYHLLLRDLGRAKPIGDLAAWIARPDAALPSGADKAAADWLAALDQ